jgi:hypothetical protein
MPIETDPLPDVIVVGVQTNTEHGFQFELNGTKCATGLRSAVELINGGLAIMYQQKADTREVMAQLVVFGRYGMTSASTRPCCSTYMKSSISTGPAGGAEPGKPDETAQGAWRHRVLL